MYILKSHPPNMSTPFGTHGVFRLFYPLRGNLAMKPPKA